MGPIGFLVFNDNIINTNKNALFFNYCSSVNAPLNTRTDISIDPSHEFAFALLTQTKLPGLTHSRKFCIVSGPDCATYPRPFHPCVSFKDT